MTPEQVVAHFGGTQVKAAEALGLRQSAVSEWFRHGYVPLGRQYEIQVLTGGTLRANPDSIKKAKQSAAAA